MGEAKRWSVDRGPWVGGALVCPGDLPPLSGAFSAGHTARPLLPIPCHVSPLAWPWPRLPLFSPSLTGRSGAGLGPAHRHSPAPRSVLGLPLAKCPWQAGGGLDPSPCWLPVPLPLRSLLPAAPSPPPFWSAHLITRPLVSRPAPACGVTVFLHTWAPGPLWSPLLPVPATPPSPSSPGKCLFLNLLVGLAGCPAQQLNKPLAAS